MPVLDGPRIGAVIVTYEPDDRLRLVVDAAVSQVDTVWIVDNGSKNRSSVRSSGGDSKDRAAIHTIDNDANRGLAAAQNQGVDAALAAGCDWILLLDQDSIPLPGMVAAMLRAARDYGAPARIGFLAPVHVDGAGAPTAAIYRRGADDGFHRARTPRAGVDDDLAFAMASGCLIPADRFHDVGPMAEDFFIDYVDYDFAFRVRRAGFRILGVAEAKLQHRLGEAREVAVLGRRFRYRAHAAQRRYTIYRNRVRVWRAHGRSIGGYRTFECLSVIKDLGKLALVEDQKWRKLRAIVIGVGDGLRGRGGFRKI